MKTMTKYRRKTKWKVVVCEATGEKCWCRCIRTICGRSEVIPAGCMPKEEVEYFVKLHNNYLGQGK